MGEKWIGMEMDVDGQIGEIVGVQKAARPQIIMRKSSGGIDLSTPEQYDFKVKFSDGKTKTIKNVRMN